MPKYPKNYKDVEYYVPGRKRRVAGSTVAFSVALVAVAGGLGVIIPPSVPFIMYGTSTNTVSVGGMFKAGVLPGLLIGAFLMAYCYFRCRRSGEDKALLIAAYNEMHEGGFVNKVLKNKTCKWE